MAAVDRSCQRNGRLRRRGRSRSRACRTTRPSRSQIMDYIGFPRVTVAGSMVVGVFDVVLLTALGTLSAYLYNICAALVGGVQLTLTDD
ncbi:MAG: DUF3566 domain-containing protein [Dermatophilaceae bacterium]